MQGESKTLAWGFAKAPYRLRAPVYYYCHCGLLCLFLVFFYLILCVHSTFAKRDGIFAFIAFLISCDCYCFVALPHGAMCSSAVMIVIFSDHTRLFF